MRKLEQKGRLVRVKAAKHEDYYGLGVVLETLYSGNYRNNYKANKRLVKIKLLETVENCPPYLLQYRNQQLTITRACLTQLKAREEDLYNLTHEVKL